MVSVDTLTQSNPQVTIKVGRHGQASVSCASESEHGFSESPLVRQGRLSVVPLNTAQFKFLTGE